MFAMHPFLGASVAHANWDYPMEIQVAYYDAAKIVCSSIIAPQDLNRGLSQMTRVSDLTNVERQKITVTQLYKGALDETLAGYKRLLKSAQSSEKVIVCKAILRMDGYGL